MTESLSAGRPAWANRIRAERDARGWSQAAAVRALRTRSSAPLPSDSALLRNWRRWESGTTKPDETYAPLIAALFGTVTNAFFPPERADRNSELIAATGMDTLEIIGRMRASDVTPATLDALHITAEQLCSEYPYVPSEQLRAEGRQWLHRMTALLNGRLTLSQHREIIEVAGWISLLLGCVEYDLGQRNQAEATRRAALSLGEESGNPDIIGWASEMSAWFALTQGNYRGAIAVTEAAQPLAADRSVGVQLAAQRAKAWARIGDRQQVNQALDEGRAILERIEHPTNLDNHFVVDPDKFDFYAMDCYRLAGDDRLAELCAGEVIRTSISSDGQIRKPMRLAEAYVTLAVVAARSGDLDGAITHGKLALRGQRQSLPSLTMVAAELTHTLSNLYPSEPETREYLDEIQAISNVSRG